MDTQHLTKAILALTKITMDDYATLITTRLHEPKVDRHCAIQYGILAAHITTLESAGAEEGLPIRSLEALAEDLLEIRQGLDNIPFGKSIAGQNS